MKQDIMIYLGPRWGQTILLSRLEKITQITELVKTKTPTETEVILRVTTDDRVLDDGTIIPFTFDSQTMTPEVAEQERRRILGYSNGILSKEDIERIGTDLEAQTGKTLQLSLDEVSYDISFIRKLMADLEGKPYYRFILQYNADTEQMEVFDSYNEMIVPIIEQWGDEKFIKNLEMDEKSLAFAYETIHRLTEDFLVAADALNGDEEPNLPAMNLGGRGSREVFDLGKMGGK